MRENKKNKKERTAKELLDYLNNTYLKLHTDFENNFWISYMGDHSVDKKMNKAESFRDSFSSNKDLKKEVENLIRKTKGTEKDRLKSWKRYFDRYDIPESAIILKEKIGEIEARIQKIQTTRKEGYIDPNSNQFIEASENKMRIIMRTDPDETDGKITF